MNEFIIEFTNQLLDTHTKLGPETVFTDLVDWDSLTAMAVMVMIEDNYKVKIDSSTLSQQKTLNDLYKYIQDHQ